MLDINHSNLILESSQKNPRRVGGERGPGVAQARSAGDLILVAETFNHVLDIDAIVDTPVSRYAMELAVASAFAFRHAENTVLYVFGLFG